MSNVFLEAINEYIGDRVKLGLIDYIGKYIKDPNYKEQLSFSKADFDVQYHNIPGYTGINNNYTNLLELLLECEIQAINISRSDIRDILINCESVDVLIRDILFDNISNENAIQTRLQDILRDIIKCEIKEKVALLGMDTITYINADDVSLSDRVKYGKESWAIILDLNAMGNDLSPKDLLAYFVKYRHLLI